MRDLLVLLAHLLTTLTTLSGLGGPRAVLADNRLMKQHLLIIHRSLGRAANRRLTGGADEREEVVRA